MNKARRILTGGWLRNALSILTRGRFGKEYDVEGKICLSIEAFVPDLSVEAALPDLTIEPHLSALRASAHLPFVQIDEFLPKMTVTVVSCGSN